jgi:hypothetical protein
LSEHVRRWFKSFADRDERIGRRAKICVDVRGDPREHGDPSARCFFGPQNDDWRLKNISTKLRGGAIVRKPSDDNNLCHVRPASADSFQRVGHDESGPFLRCAKNVGLAMTQFQAREDAARTRIPMGESAPC